MAELQPPRAEPTMAAPSAAAAVAPSARVMRQRLEDPFTKQRLLFFLCLHLVAFGAEIAAMVVFFFTRDLLFLFSLLVPFLFSGLFCTYAAYHCELPTTRSRLLPLKDRHWLLRLVLVVPMGLLQGVILWLAVEEYRERNAERTTLPLDGSGWQRRGRSSSTPPNKYHCKAVNGIFEGIASSMVLLYALVGFLGVVCFLSTGLGVMELDYCTSRTIAKRMRRFWYEVIHWLFRTCELISRVCMFVAFMVTTRQKPQWRWWWCILLADFCFTAFIVTVLGGAEGTYVVRILCSSPAVFANIFAFIDSPYKRRSAKLVSRWLTIKHGLELILLPLLLYIGLREELWVDLKDNWKNHQIMIVIALTASVLYWPLLAYISSKSMHRSNMTDIFSACETGSKTEVQRAIRDLTRSAAICLNVNSPDVDGRTPLMLAAARGHADVCALLVQQGANVELRRLQDNRKCRTLLTISLRRRWTALHIAAWHGHLKVVQILLDAARGRAAGERNAEDYWNYMFQDSANETPLHVAARGGWLEVCCCLAHHVPLWKMAMLQEPNPAIELCPREVRQAIVDPGDELLQRSMDLRSTPLLDAAASLPNMEGWPQVQVAIDRSQHEQLIAPGLCSYIASCCGGALGRAFLMDAQPEPPEIHQSVLTDISEATESSETSLARGTGASGARHGANWETEAPNIDHLVPVTPTNTRVIAQWSEMSSSMDAAMRRRGCSGGHIRGCIIRRIPEIGIGAILGQGSYGVVWCAMDERTDKLYAVKNICKAPTTSEVSRREFEVSDRIRLTPHPCLVQLFLVHNFTDAGLYVLVMEYCSGGNLLRRIQQRRHLCGIGSYRAPSTAIAWIAQVFLGLEHMHLRMDTLLRDLKPDNVVLSEKGVAKLTDFGFGRFGVESTSGLWSFGVPAGSPGYVAPEVILQQNYDYSADLYSLGVLTWVLLSGGLVNVEPPQPPTGQRRTVNDFRAHAQDCDLLLRCLEDPRSNGALRLRRHEQDFVAKLIDRRPERRLSHRQIRAHRMISELPNLPKYEAPSDEVKRWVEEVSETKRQ
ncbi:unnamed protein product [Durusdinium trenchii]|uniref:Protein kinase domain-containing protein n=1 Tax=Durusdinium trenchii TaxID=1381693 RepID=A0ABP0IFK3_9DINO